MILIYQLHVYTIIVIIILSIAYVFILENNKNIYIFTKITHQCNNRLLIWLLGRLLVYASIIKVTYGAPNQAK